MFRKYIDGSYLKLGVGAFLIIATAFFLLFLGTSNTTNKDTTDGEFFAPNVAAFLSYQGRPFSATDSVVSETFIKEDLADFARINYSSYGNDNRIPVEFLVEDFSKEDNRIVINGSFDMVSSRIQVFIDLLKNDRLKLSIVDSTKNIQQDEKLTSNSVENQLIGSLPITEDDYIISYEPPSFISVSANFRDTSIFEAARARLASLVGEENLSKLEISISYPTPGFLDE